MPSPVYLDYAATAPLHPEVLEVMMPHLTKHYGNASSVHSAGRTARVAVEQARGTVARILGCAPAEIVFTSGGTEANNAALRGVLTGEALRETGRPGLVTSATEHEAVLRPAQRLKEEGHPVTTLPPDAHGAVTPDQVEEALTDETGLVSVMWVNNEVGTVSPVPEIAERCRARAALLHTDAVQAAGVLSVDLDALGADLLTISGHKLGGPKGIGALAVRAGTPLSGFIVGGGQERGRRGGTENVASVVGFAEALRLAESSREEEAVRLAALRNRLAGRLREAVGEALRFNTPLRQDGARAAPHILNVSVRSNSGAALDGEMLLLSLDMAGVQVSAGSACTSGALEPSHVLLAMGVPRETAAATVRFSLGRGVTEADVDRAAAAFITTVTRMQGRK